MSLCAIICEYNPLHRGHLWQIEQAKQRFDAVVCVMSGSFVQRGEPAILDKFTRARWALEAGADAVFELPCAYVLQSAEAFAAGGVRLAAALGATHLCFGSETQDVSLLARLAHLCVHSFASLRPALSRALSAGQSYPAAFQAAVQQVCPVFPNEVFLPNALLGVEYLKAIERHALPLVPVALPRQLPLSSSRCRVQAEQGAYPDVPDFVAHRLAGGPQIRFSQLAPSLLYRLRMMGPADYAALPFVSEGLENRLYHAARRAVSLDELLGLCRTRRYPLARLKRLLCCALLHVAQDDLARANGSGPAYARLLALDPQNRPVRQALKRCALPVCTTGLAAEPYAASALDRRATDLHALLSGRPCGLDYTVPLFTSA